MTQQPGQPVQQSPQQRVIAGRYVVQREIGRGGMGVVWLADDQMIGRRVAIKELHLPDGVPSEERSVVEQRVLREARTAGRLNDPAIVTVYDVLQESGGTYIVMELLDAPTLSDVVRERGPLPADQVVSLAGQLLSALQAAHDAGVVHRDVKPSNIMLLRNGHVKLTDFGIAQSMDDPRLTTTGILIGSPTYMAPERIRGAEADASSDLWALGAVLFFAVEGYAPFERQTTAATMHAVLTEVPYLTRVGGPLASLVMGLLVGSPQGRLTAEQSRGLLGQARTVVSTGDTTSVVNAAPGNGTAFYARPGSTMPGTAAPARRRLLPVLFTVLVALVAGLLAGFFGRGALAGSDAPTTPAEQERALTYGPGAGSDLTEFDISVSEKQGVCLAGRLAPGRTVTSSLSVQCDNLHDVEVVYQWDLGDRSSDPSQPRLPYPGHDLLAAATNARCALYFTSWIAAADRVGLHYQAVIPSQQGWDEPAPDNDYGAFRSAYCVVFLSNGNQMPKHSVAFD